MKDSDAKYRRCNHVTGAASNIQSKVSSKKQKYKRDNWGTITHYLQL